VQCEGSQQEVPVFGQEPLEAKRIPLSLNTSHQSPERPLRMVVTEPT
jgi:hypothetical protein